MFFSKQKQIKFELADVVVQLLSPRFGRFTRGCVFYPQGISDCRESLTSEIFLVCLILASLVCAPSIIFMSPRAIDILVGSSGAVSALCRCAFQMLSSLADKLETLGFAAS